MFVQLETNDSSWISLDKCISTNTFLMEGDFPSGTICLAREQSDGRGRRNNAWESLKDKSFIFSALIHVPSSLLRETLSLNLFPVLSGVALLEALDEYLASTSTSSFKKEQKRGDELYFKWPNDIYILRKIQDGEYYGKLAGILIENRTERVASTEEEYMRIVIGIGLNWSGDDKVMEELGDIIAKKNLEKEYIPPISLYHNFQKIPPLISFTKYLVASMNKILAQVQGGDLSFIERARGTHFLRERLISYAKRNYYVRGLSDKCELIIEDMATGEQKNICSTEEEIKLIGSI